MSHRAPATGLLGPTAVMALGTVLSRALGFVRASVLAWALGLNIVGSAYLVANTVPSVLFALLAGGTINAVLVPQLVRAMRRGVAQGQAYTDRLLTLAALALAALTALVTLAAPVLARVYAGLNWTPDELALTTALALWCLPQVFFLAAFTLVGQVLNARGVFGPMMFAPIVNNVVVIATAALFVVVADADTTNDAGAATSLSGGEIAFLGAGTTLGVVAQAAVLLPVLRRSGFRFRPRLDLRGAGLGRAGHLAGWSVGFVAANQVAYWVVTKVANTAGQAGDGDAAGMPAYANAYLLLLLPHGVVVVSLATALLPRMSAAAARGDVPGVLADVVGALRTTVFVLVPVVAVMVVLALPLSRVAFPGNDAADTRAIGLALLAFAPGLLPFAVHFLLNRVFYAVEDTRTPFLLQCGLVVVTSSLAVAVGLLLDPRRVVVGLALGHTVTYTVGAVVSAVLVRRRFGPTGGALLARRLGRLLALVAVPAALAGAVVVGCGAWLDGYPADLVALLVGTGTLLGGYLVLARGVAAQELAGLRAQVRARTG